MRALNGHRLFRLILDRLRTPLTRDELSIVQTGIGLVLTALPTMQRLGQGIVVWQRLRIARGKTEATEARSQQARHWNGTDSDGLY